MAHKGSTDVQARYSEAGAALHGLLGALQLGDPARPALRISRSRLALLRALATSGPQTVSALARSRGLARQGIQRLADALAAEGLVRFVANPRHRRASRVALTDAGRARYAGLAAAEARWLNDLAEGLPAEELRRAARLLRELSRRLSGRPDPG